MTEYGPACQGRRHLRDGTRIADGTVAATVELVSVAAATVGSVVLFLLDGAFHAAEVSGDEAVASGIEDDKTVQWVRNGATLMLLPDVPVGRLRSCWLCQVRDIGMLQGATLGGTALMTAAPPV